MILGFCFSHVSHSSLPFQRRHYARAHTLWLKLDPERMEKRAPLRSTERPPLQERLDQMRSSPLKGAPCGWKPLVRIEVARNLQLKHPRVPPKGGVSHVLMAQRASIHSMGIAVGIGTA